MKQLPGPIKLLQDAWLIYKMRARTIVLLVVISFVVSWAMSIVLVFSIILGAVLAIIIKSVWIIGALILAGTALFLVVVFVQTWFNIALISSVVFYRDDKSIGQLLSESRAKVLRFWWISLLCNLIIMFGFLIFLVPGFIFSVWFGFTVFILISENIGGMDALLRSREYVKGYFWSTLFRFAFITLLFIVGEIFIFAINLLLAYLKLTAISNFAVPILWIILSPLFLIYSFLIYDNLKAIKGMFEFKPSTLQKGFFYFFAAVPLILLILAIAVIVPQIPNLINLIKGAASSKNITAQKITDCGSVNLTNKSSVNPGINCFANAALSCTPAKVESTQILTHNSIDTVITSEYELQKISRIGQGEMCRLKFKTISAYNRLSKNITKENYDRATSESSKFINELLGNEGYCAYHLSNSSKVFEIKGWDQTNLTRDAFKSKECQGNFFYYAEEFSFPAVPLTR